MRRVLALVLALAVAAPPAAADAAAPPNKYASDAWDGKLRYGAYSTLISSHLMRTEFPWLAARLADPTIPLGQIRREVQALRTRFGALRAFEVAQILAYAAADRTPTIFEEERSVFRTDDQAAAFLAGMAAHPELEPVDRMVRDGAFASANFQFNTHRGLYNNAYLIPQNSLAAIANAYVAGIRSVEFDVMESAEHEAVVIHDLVTNRLDGGYAAPPRFVELTGYDDLKSTPIDVLNPLAPTPTVDTSGVDRLMRLEHVLDVVHEVMPELTLYVDARNNSPVAVIDLLLRRPELKENLVVKVYPFTLHAGAKDLVSLYAARKGVSPQTAARQIADLKPNILLALGNAATQASEAAGVSGFTDFTYRTLQNARPQLPYAKGATGKYNQYDGAPIFSPEQLAIIEGMSWKLFRWAADFSAVSNVLVYQVGLLPSIKDIAVNPDLHPGEFAAMKINDKLNSAATDNFVELWLLASTGKMPVKVYEPDGTTSDYGALVQAMRWGFSDRYPDFTLAARDGQGQPVEAGLRDFLYSMEGTTYEKCDFAAAQMRSSQAALNKIEEMTRDGLKIGYATTDLPTDLRAGRMGLLGTRGLPADLRYRMSAIVKERHTPADLATYRIPIWSTRLWGSYQDIPWFAGDLARIQGAEAEYRRLGAAEEAFASAKANGDLAIINGEALRRLGTDQPVFAADLPTGVLEDAVALLEADLSDVGETLKTLDDAFKRRYAVTYKGEPVPPDYYWPQAYPDPMPEFCIAH